MNASSTTTTRLGRRQPQPGPRPGAARRSGWSGCPPRRGRRPPARAWGRAGSRRSRGSSTTVTSCPARLEGGVRLGELGVDDDRPAPLREPGDQRRTPRPRRAVTSTSSGRRPCRPRQCPRGPRDRGSAAASHALDERLAPSQLRPGLVDVDGEVHQPGAELAVAVVEQRLGRRPSTTRTRLALGSAGAVRRWGSPRRSSGEPLRQLRVPGPVEVEVRRVQGRRRDADLLPRPPTPAPSPGRPGQRGAVELVRRVTRSPVRRQQAVAERPRRRGSAASAAGHRGGRPGPRRSWRRRRATPGQVEQPGTLRDRRRGRPRRRPAPGAAAGRVGGQLGRRTPREPAAEVDARGCRAGARDRASGRRRRRGTRRRSSSSAVSA